ncbi:MAG TPA: hypothetical protein VIQ54_32245 [Polyangia bacterium]
MTNHKGLPCRGLTSTSCSLYSVGVGARAGFGTKVAASLDVGHALRDGVTTAKGDTRVHVSLTVAF